MFSACSDDWDDHYKTRPDNEEMSPLTLKEYFEGNSSYSKFYELLKSTGVADELGKDQYLTVWAIDNDHYDYTGLESLNDSLVAKYHVCNLSFGLNDLKDGLRIRALNGKYVTIYEDGNAFEVNRVKITSSLRFKNGTVHVISSLLEPKNNIFDYLQSLSDDYSIIRDSIMYYNIKVFDKANSVPIGVDASGSTIYDSVFYMNNPLFEKADLTSEYKNFTAFIPSNRVIEDCFEKLDEQYKSMNQLFQLKDTLTAINWIKEAIFHNGAVEDYGTVTDLNSAFGKVWRTTVQQVDLNSRQDMSNGLIYDVQKIKIPNGIIITRIKSLIYYYDFLSAEDQATLYIARGLKPGEYLKSATFDKDPKGEPYMLLTAAGDPNSDDEFSVEFPPLEFDKETQESSVMQVPVGEYKLYLGFRSTAHPYVDVYFESGDGYVPMTSNAIKVASELKISDSSPWNYDRVTETESSKYNGLGGFVGNVTVTGNEMGSFRLKVKFNRANTAGSAKTLSMYHWALKPTENNY
ncbi:MAG: fasciclin domain-containing protein [Dysgonomonas sp.]